MRGLSDKVVIVAGAATGIGAASAVRLGEEGAKVVVADMDLSGAQAVADAIAATGREAIALQYDQGSEASIVAVVAEAARHFGALHGLHANAADTRSSHVESDRPLDAMDVAVWEQTMRVNVIGYALLIRECAPRIVAAGGGAIVLTTSVAANLNDPDGKLPAYSSSKAAVNSVCRRAAAYWGKQGLRCNAVAPGVVMTDTLRAVLPQATIDGFLASTRSTRLGRAEDIAAAAAFLLSGEAEWVNGQVWTVDGGLTFRD